MKLANADFTPGTHPPKSGVKLANADFTPNAALDSIDSTVHHGAVFENFVVVGSSTEEIGVVSPGYGVSDNLVDGTTYAFTARIRRTHRAN